MSTYTIISDGDDELEVSLWRSENDGQLTLHIGTTDIKDNQDGPVLRVILNDDYDDPIWENKA